MVICESGGTVYTADLKSAACNGLTGSSPVSRTKFCLARKVNGGWASWGASWLDTPPARRFIWLQSVHGRTQHCHCWRRGSLPLEAAKLFSGWRIGKVTVNAFGKKLQRLGGSNPPQRAKIRVRKVNGGWEVLIRWKRCTDTPPALCSISYIPRLERV